MRTVRLSGDARLTQADLNRSGALPAEVIASAEKIVDDVRERGDAAVRECCLRFDRACALLKDPDMQIQTIAQQVGYVDARSFIRKFKSYYGITPGEYRQEWTRPSGCD